MEKIKSIINSIFSLFGYIIIKETSVKKINVEILKEPIIEDEYKEYIKKIEDIFGKRQPHHIHFILFTLYVSIFMKIK